MWGDTRAYTFSNPRVGRPTVMSTYGFVPNGSYIVACAFVHFPNLLASAHIAKEANARFANTSISILMDMNRSDGRSDINPRIGYYTVIWRFAISPSD